MAVGRECISGTWDGQYKDTEMRAKSAVHNEWKFKVIFNEAGKKGWCKVRTVLS